MKQPYNPNDALWMYENANGVVKVSYWSMGLYETCPGKYHHTASQTPLPLGVVPDKRTAVVGSIEHSIIEEYFHEKNFEKTDLTAGVERALENFLVYNNVKWRSAEDKKQIIAEIKTDLSSTYQVLKEAGVLVPQAKPELTVQGYLNHRILLKGRIDLYVEDPDNATVIDNKAVEKTENLDVHQLTFYRLLLRKAGKPVPDRLGWYLTKFGYIKWREIDEDDEKKLSTRIEEVAEGIRSKKFPYRPSPYHCQWCDYNTTCVAFQNKFPNQGLLSDIKAIKTSGTVKF